jgi:hypothetical protein
MSTTYIATADPTVVIKQDQADIDLTALIQQYQSLKQEYLSLPDYNKTIPDQETLDFWNTEMSIMWDSQAQVIKTAAAILLSKVQPIYDAGLLPVQYEDDYNLLVNFVNS